MVTRAIPCGIKEIIVRDFLTSRRNRSVLSYSFTVGFLDSELHLLIASTDRLYSHHAFVSVRCLWLRSGLEGHSSNADKYLVIS